MNNAVTNPLDALNRALFNKGTEQLVAERQPTPAPSTPDERIAAIVKYQRQTTQLATQKQTQADQSVHSFQPLNLG